MKTLKITKKDLDKDNYYIGKTDVTDYDGHIEIAGSLGWVRFKRGISAKGSLYAVADTGIKTGDGIKTGGGIETGGGIVAGLTITCKKLSSELRIFAGVCIWKNPTTEEKQIRCEELVKGEIAYGELVITKPKPGLCAGKIVEIDGKKYKLEEI